MTAVGKILVFLNLLFSLVVGGFVVFAYIARAHWADAYKKLEAQNQVLNASATTYKSQVDKAREEANGEIAKANAEKNSAQKDLMTATQTITQLRDENTKLRGQVGKDTTLASKYTVEVEKRQDDVAKLRSTLDLTQKKVIDVEKRNAELVHEATVAKIERDAMKDLASRVEQELQRQQKELVRMKANGGVAATVRAGGKNPPPEPVEGLVKNTDSSGLMTLTIGSDAGLTKGHTLELFRLNTAMPSQSRYLGTVRIVESTPHESVAQPVSRLSGAPQPGDRVASQIQNGGS
jgi:hypothetical protein